MNFKLFSFLISLVAAVSLAPTEKAFGQPQHQMNVEEVQHLICVREPEYLRCNVETSKEPNQDALQKTKATQSSKSALVTVVPAPNPDQQRSVDQINQYQTTNTVDRLIFFIIVCSSGLGLFLYKRYRTNRVTVLRQNIEVLERLWKTSNIQ